MLSPFSFVLAAGTPILASQNVEDTITFPMHLIRNNNSFMLRVKGDSMINVGIFDGCKIVHMCSHRSVRQILPLTAKRKFLMHGAE